MKRTFFLLLWLILFGRLSAQIPVYNDMLITHYTVEDGLPNNMVNCSLKTSDGFVWFGTWYGLSRFDGMKFSNFSKAYSQTSDQPPRKIENLIEDNLGNIWIKSSDWKLSVLFKKTERFEDVYDELKSFARNLQVIKMQKTSDGKVLLLTKDKNLLLACTTLDGKVEVRRLLNAHSYIDKTSYRLKRNIIQISAGRANWEDRTYHIYSIPLSGKSPRSLAYWQQKFQEMVLKEQEYSTKSGLIWHVSSNSLLICKDKKGGREWHYPLSLQGQVTNPAFVEVPRIGYFYLSSAGEVIFVDARTMKGENIAFRNDFSDKHSDSRFFSMRLDTEGILWLTSTTIGVYKMCFPPRQFGMFGLPLERQDGIRCIYQHSNGDIWVGTRSKNLLILDDFGRLKKVLGYKEYGIGSVYFIMQDRQGRLWLSTKGDGLVQAIPDASQKVDYRFVHYKHETGNPASISGNNVYMTCEDSHGRIWVGTLDGGLNLIQEHNGKIKFLNMHNGMDHYPGYGLYVEVRNMAEDRYGRLWVGTIDGLMSVRLDFKSTNEIKFENYRTTEINTKANSDIYSLYRDRERNVWLCTFGGGLSQIEGYDPQSRLPLFKSLGMGEGIENDVIISIIEDGKGRLWLANNHGISCFDPRNNSTRDYGQVDGFPNVTLEENSGSYIRNGQIWVGCKTGILTFNPEKLHSSTTKYPVYIVGCEVNNKDVRSYIDPPLFRQSIIEAEHLELHHDQSMFTLEFSALNYRNPANVTYRYRLQDYDRDWHYNGNNRIASYSNVPSGKYTFEVEAIDDSNPNLRSRASLQIVILPPWWATWYAYTFYFILIVIGVLQAIKYAKYQIKLKNDVYVQSRLAEFKMKFYLEQEETKFLEKVSDVVKANLENPDLDIDMIAQNMGMSRSAFFKKLKSLTGLSPVEYVRDAKLNHAVDMLRLTDESIADIAYKSGFSDAGYFGKCFKKKYGMSPSDYAHSNKARGENTLKMK